MAYASKSKVQLPAKGRAHLNQFGSSTETHAYSLHVYNSLGGCSNNGIQNLLEQTAVHYSQRDGKADMYFVSLHEMLGTG